MCGVVDVVARLSFWRASILPTSCKERSLTCEARLEQGEEFGIDETKQFTYLKNTFEDNLVYGIQIILYPDLIYFYRRSALRES